ncbi:MAG: MFS transporter [Thermomicrobiales bacterium]
MEGAVSGPRVRSGILGFGRDITILLVLLLAAGAVGGPARSLFPVYLERDLHWAAPAIAALTTARLLAAALSAPIGGTLADIAGPRRALWCGLLGLPVAASLFLLSVPPALIFLMLAIGVADGMQSTGSQSYLVTRASGKTIGLATGAFYVGSTLGGALGNLGAGTLLDGWGFRALGWAGLGGGLLVLVGALALPAGSGRSGGGRHWATRWRGIGRCSGFARAATRAVAFPLDLRLGDGDLPLADLIARMSGDRGTAARSGRSAWRWR